MGLDYNGRRNFLRRKRVDSIEFKTADRHRLAKRLSLIDIVAIGVGATIGAGVYILVGTVAREQTGPALTISFLIAGIAAALSAFCYAELACRCPSAGSAYHYAYICMGEGAAWLIGWALILEYTIGGSAIARGLTPNLALFFGGDSNLPSYLARHPVPGVGIVVDPCAAILVLVVTVLLCLGIKEYTTSCNTVVECENPYSREYSSIVQTIVTTVNVLGMLFIITVGGYLAFRTGWVGYDLPSGFFPLGINGMLAGSGVVFFSFIGFDVVASTAEEVKNPQKDLPLGIGISLSLCCILYMLVSVVIVGLVPYYALDPDTPISTAFSSHGMQWAVYVITTGAVTALCASLMGSLLPQPRMFMAMARDGLLPTFFSDISERTQVPVKSTVIIGILAAALAFFMDVSQLAGMVSVGTLLAFTAVAISVLILRYAPPEEVPLPSSLLEAFGSLADGARDIQENASPSKKGIVSDNNDSQCFLQKGSTSSDVFFLQELVNQDERTKRKRQNIAVWNIIIALVGVLVLASSASYENLPRILRFTFCTIGAALIACSLTILTRMGQDNTTHSFGHTGGFICPFVPFLPVASVLVNTYLLINLGIDTWIRVLLWLLIGALVYLFYGRTHSALKNAIYVPRSYADEIYRTSSNHLV